MPQVRILGWVQSRLQFQTSQGTFGEITLNWKSALTSSWSTAELGVLNVNIWTALNALVTSIVPNTIVFTRIISTDLGPTGLTQHTLNLASAVGTAPGDVEPYNVTQVISQRTGLVGRSFRGRTYFPPTADTNYVNGLAIPAFIVGLTNVANALLGFTNSGGRTVDWAVASRRLQTLTAIASVIIDNLPDSQRRRLPGRGS